MITVRFLKKTFSLFKGMEVKMWVALAAVFFSTATVMAKDIRTAVFKVSQMTCENCVKKINSNIRFEKGLKEFDTDLKTKTVTITYDADKTSIEKLKEGFRKFHYEADLVKEIKVKDKK